MFNGGPVTDSFHRATVNNPSPFSSYVVTMTAPSIVANPPPMSLCVDCRRTDVPTYRNVKIQASSSSSPSSTGPLLHPEKPKPSTSNMVVQANELTSTATKRKPIPTSNRPLKAPAPTKTQTAPDQTKTKHVADLSRRLKPKSDKDFNELQSELREWRDREQDKILASHPATQIGLEQETLAKEGFLLRKIDGLKAKENKGRRAKRIDSELADMAKPNRWTLSNGEEVLVDTPASTHANHLRRIYNGLAESGQDAGTDSKKTYLVEARAVVSASSHSDSISKDLIELIDRELDLLGRGVDEKVVQSLNMRVRNLLLQFIQADRHNPSASICSLASLAKPVVKLEKS